MDRNSFTDKIIRHHSEIKGVYKECFRIDPELALFEIAQQANTNIYSRMGAINVVGPCLVNLALELFPDARLGSTFKRKYRIRS